MSNFLVCNSSTLLDSRVLAGANSIAITNFNGTSLRSYVSALGLGGYNYIDTVVFNTVTVFYFSKSANSGYVTPSAPPDLGTFVVAPVVDTTAVVVTPVSVPVSDLVKAYVTEAVGSVNTTLSKGISDLTTSTGTNLTNSAAQIRVDYGQAITDAKSVLSKATSDLGYLAGTNLTNSAAQIRIDYAQAITDAKGVLSKATTDLGSSTTNSLTSNLNTSRSYASGLVDTLKGASTMWTGGTNTFNTIRADTYYAQYINTPRIDVTTSIVAKAVSADSVVSEGSVTAKGLMTGANVTATGTLKAGIVSCDGDVKGASLTATGVVSGGSVSGTTVSCTSLAATTAIEQTGSGLMFGFYSKAACLSTETIGIPRSGLYMICVFSNDDGFTTGSWYLSATATNSSIIPIIAPIYYGGNTGISVTYNALKKVFILYGVVNPSLSIVIHRLVLY